MSVLQAAIARCRSDLHDEALHSTAAARAGNARAAAYFRHRAVMAAQNLEGYLELIGLAADLELEMEFDACCPDQSDGNS